MERNNGERNVYFGQCCREVVWYFDGEISQIDERRGVCAVSLQLAGPEPTHLSSLPGILSNKKE